MAAELILGRYRPLGSLGKGGGGSVELCWDTRIQRRVAIKRMALAEGTPGAQVPGLAEARTGAMLNHPSIVSVYDFETRGNEAFLIMEAIEGPSLRTVIKDTPAGEFDLDIVACIATSIANALAFAHQHQVLHLDVKPDNILITANGTAKVSDFGIAQLVDAAGTAHAAGGTIGYMPPEQMRREALDESCDVFAFAVLVYEMLTGKNPYRAKSIEGSLKNIEQRHAPGPSTLRDDLDCRIDEVLARAMAAEPAQRYPSIGAFFTELAPFLGDAPEGIAKLAGVVTGAQEEEAPALPPGEEAQEPRHGPLLARVGERTRLVAGRVLAAALCWWLGFLGLETFAVLGVPLAAAMALLAALAALAKPVFGALVALVMLAVGLLANPFGYTDLALMGSPLLGLIVLAGLALWFGVVGREQLAKRGSAADVNCALLVAPLGLIHLTPLAPLVAGLCLPVRRACMSSLLSVLLALVLGLATGSGSLLWFEPTLATATADLGLADVFGDAATWIVVFAWILATVCLSLLAARATRVSSVFGIVLAAVILLAAQVLAQWVRAGALLLPTAEWALSVGAAVILTCVSVALGAPQRDRGEK